MAACLHRRVFSTDAIVDALVPSNPIFATSMSIKHLCSSTYIASTPTERVGGAHSL
jgi:hypothetical protein